MDTCVVTGSTGFLGGHVAAALAHSGRRVLAVSRRLVRSRLENIIPVHAPLEQLDPLWSAIGQHGCQAIFHFAAALPNPGVPFSFELASSTNVLGTARLLDLVAQTKPRVVVFASSISIYAPTADVLREDSAIVPGDPYAFSKYCGELACSAFTTQTGIRSVSLRISSPYGPGMNERTVLPLFLRAAIAGKVPRYHGSGSRKQNFVHAEDVAQACLHALDHGAGAYNVGGHSASMRQLAGLALEAGGRQAREAEASGLPDPQEGRVYDVNSDRAAAELRYAPRYTLEAGTRSLYVALTRGEPLRTWWEEA